MHIRLHSDDMGVTDAQSRTMLDCWTRRTIAGFSILANGAGNDRVAATLGVHPDRDAYLAVHLNLCEGPSTAPPSQVPLLVDPEGNLRRGFPDVLLRTLGPGRTELLRQIEVEWRAQIDAVRRLVAPRALAALDGHNHFHMIPTLFALATRLASEYRIPRVRVVSEPIFLQERRDLARPGFYTNLGKNRLLWLLSFRARRIARVTGRAFDDRVLGVLHAGELRSAGVRRGLAAAARSGAGSVEVMYHLLGRARPSEADRWDHVPRFRAWYLHAARESEIPEAAEIAKELGAPQTVWRVEDARRDDGSSRATSGPLR